MIHLIYKQQEGNYIMAKKTLTLEDRVNNEFDEMAVSVAYGKNEGEKLKAVRDFNAFIDNNVPAEDKEKIKALVEERLKDNDFIYGSEFIDLSSLKEYANRLFEERKVEKEFEAHSSEMPAKEENKKQSPTLTLEDRVNNEFDEMAVSVAYGKNEGEKLKAVRAFNTFIDNNVPAEDKDKVKALVEERLKDNDFIYGSEFIDLTPLKEYTDRLFEERKVAKEFELHSSEEIKKEAPENLSDVVQSVKKNANNTLGGILSGLAENAAKREERKMPSPNPDQEAEKALHQALLDGIANEEIKNIKGYSNDDLKKILAYHDKLLNADDGNGTAFESLYDNSIADLKKFAEGNVSIDNDSYETMMQFIKTFGTNSKGQLLPEGKAAYDKLMSLMAEQQRQKILANKKEYQKNISDVVHTVKDNANNTLAGILGGLAANAAKREKETAEKTSTAPEMTKGKAPTEFAIGDEDAEKTSKVMSPENHHHEPDKPDNTTHTPITPIPPSTERIPFQPENTTNETPKPQPEEKKKGFWSKAKDWIKDKWKWIAATAAAAGLLLLKTCSGGDKAVAPTTPDKDKILPDKTVILPNDSIEKTTPQDTLQLTSEDLSNGFYLERSAGFKSEQAGISFNDAEKANKEDLLTLKRLVAQKKLDMNQFKRHETSQNKAPVSLAEVAYKMRIVTQNFPNSKMAQSMENIFSGKVSEKDKNNLYGAFTHIDDYGQLIDKNGKPIDTINMDKEISAERRGPGSQEYGTEGTDNNFIQVLKNHKDSLSK